MHIYYNIYKYLHILISIFKMLLNIYLNKEETQRGNIPSFDLIYLIFS